MSGRDVLDHPPGDPCIADGAAPQSTRSRAAPASVTVGQVVALMDDGGTPIVLVRGVSCTSALPARTTVELQARDIGREVVIAFEGGDVSKPVVMGLLVDNRARGPEHWPGNVEMGVDGGRMVVTAAHELVLRCGKASIVLTEAGKVLIRGEYVLSQAFGTNKIKGGSVNLN